MDPRILKSLPARGWAPKVKKDGTPSVRLVHPPEVGVGAENFTPNQFSDPTLTAEEAYAACGPAAAVAFARSAGRNPTLREALDLAKQVGWNPNMGMAGPQSEQQLMEKLGIRTRSVAPEWDVLGESVTDANPAAISTPGHYFVATGYDPANGAYYVGNSGTAYKAGKDWMTPQEMEAIGGSAQAFLRMQEQPESSDVGTAMAQQKAAPQYKSRQDFFNPEEIKDATRWRGAQFGTDEQTSLQDLLKDENRDYFESAMGMARAGEIKDILGTGQDVGLGTGLLPEGKTKEDYTVNIGPLSWADPGIGPMAMESRFAPRPQGVHELADDVADTVASKWVDTEGKPWMLMGDHYSDSEQLLRKAGVSLRDVVDPIEEFVRRSGQMRLSHIYRDRYAVTAPHDLSVQQLQYLENKFGAASPHTFEWEIHAPQETWTFPRFSGQGWEDFQKALRDIWSEGLDVGGGQDAPAWDPPTVGLGAEDSIFDYIGNQANKVGDLWNRGEYGGAVFNGMMLPFDVLNRGVDYGLGVLGGAAQAATGATSYNNFLGAGELPTTQNLGDVLDYRRAMERVDTMNPLWRTAAEIGGGLALPVSPLGKAARAIDSSLQGINSTEKAVQAVQAARLGSTVETPLTGAMADLMTNPAARGAADRVKRIADIAGPVGGALAGATYTPEGEDPGIVGRAINTAAGAMLGATAVKGVEWAGSRLPWAVGGDSLGQALIKRDPILSTLAKSDLADDTKATVTTLLKAQQLMHGMPVGESAAGIPFSRYGFGIHPGSEKGLLFGFGPKTETVDRFKMMFIDSTAPIKRWNTTNAQQIGAALWPKMKAAIDAGDEAAVIELRNDWTKRLSDTDFYTRMRLVNGVAKVGEQKLRLMMSPLAARLKDGEGDVFSLWLATKENLNRAERGQWTNLHFMAEPEIVKKVGTLEEARAQAKLAAAGDPELTRLWATPKGQEAVENSYREAYREAYEEWFEREKPGLKERLAAQLADFENNYVAKQFGADAVRRFNEAAEGMYPHWNRLLLSEVDAELILPESAQKMIAERNIYGHMVDSEFFHGGQSRDADAALTTVFGKQVSKARTYLPGDVLVGQEHTNPSALTGLSLPQMNEYFLARNAVVQKQKVFLNMRRAALEGLDVVDDAGNVVGKQPSMWSQVMVKVKDDKGKFESIPQGWKMISGFAKVGPEYAEDEVTVISPAAIVQEFYRVPDILADALMGMSPENADAVTRVVNGISSKFRAGITSLSLPFIFRNVQRDLFNTLTVNGLDSLSYKNYLGAVYDAVTNGSLGGVLEKFAHLPSVKNFDPLADADSKLGALVRAKLPVDSPTKITTSYAKDASGKLVHEAGSLDAKAGTTKALSWMQEMMEEGGGLGTISEGLKTRTNEQIAKEVLGGFDLGQMAPWEVIRMAGEISELSTRVGVYSTQRMKDIARAGDDAAKLRTAGRSKEQIEKVLAGAEEISKERAALKAREATIDFSRAGQVTRILNSWIPLLNARVQGSVRNVEALASDPYGYMFRHALLTVIPQVATYRYAQEYFKDAWDEIPQAEKNANFIIPFGWYTTDAGERVPLRFKIPRDNVQQLLSIPLDYLLDTISNIEHDNQPLTVEQRNARGAWGTLKDELISQSPVDINPDELFDGHTFMQALGKGIGRAMPVIGIPGQLLSGTDWRTNRKLWDPADPYDPERPDTVSGPAIKWISEKLGLGETWGPAPSQLAFTIKSLGPGFQMFAGAGDMLVETLGAAPPKPLNYEAMVIPPDTDPAKADKVAADLSGRDLRPAWARYASFLIGSSGGAQTITAKASTADPKTALAQRETRDMNNAFNRWLNDPGEDGYLGKQRAIEKAAWDQRTHGEVISDFSDLEGSRKPYRLGLKDQYKNAITDARERRAFNASLPGIPVDVAWRDAALKEAAPSQIAQAAAEWNNPPQLGGRPDLMSNPQVLDRVHYDIVQKYAKEFGIEPKDLQDQIAAYNAGVRLPVLPLPAEYIEDALNIFFEPEIRDENNWEAGPVQVYKKKETDAEVFAAAQQASLAQFARHYGVPVGDLWERVAARLSFPEETSSPLKNSWNKAMSLAAEARNPANHPSFLDSAGNALGTWSDWTQFNATIEAHKGTDYKKLPINVRMLVDAKKRADLARVEFLQSDPDYDNYQRWFGVGRSLTEREWQEYQQGTTETGVPVRKYTVGDPADWTEFDKVLAQYSAMPQSDFRRQMMASRVKQIKKWMNPKWKSVLQQAEVDMNTDTAEEMDMLLGMAQE